MQDNEQKMLVEVAYALPCQQLITLVHADHSMTVEKAIQASGILQKFPEINLRVNKVGIFGKLSKLDSTLRHMDRIEIYRPLKADPKELRKQRVAASKVLKRGDERKDF